MQCLVFQTDLSGCPLLRTILIGRVTRIMHPHLHWHFDEGVLKMARKVFLGSIRKFYSVTSEKRGPLAENRIKITELTRGTSKEK